MNVVRQSEFSQIVVSHIIPEMEEMLYTQVEKHIQEMLEEIFDKHAAVNTEHPGAKYFYFQGKFYMSSTINKHYISSNVRPTFTVHYSLVEDMQKVVEYMNDTAIKEEKTTILNGIRRLARKACNIHVFNYVISSPQHTATMRAYVSRDLSDDEIDLGNKLKDEFEPINKLMQYRRTANLLMF